MKFDSTRERLPTRSFGWVDRRVITAGYLASLSQSQIAVYLVLCVVGDRRGISYYNPGSLAKLVKQPEAKVREALLSLREQHFIAQDGRFYQVLPLEALGQGGRGDPSTVVAPGGRTGAAAQPCAEVAPTTPSPEEILTGLPAGQREHWLSAARQRLASLTGSRTSSPAVVCALAASLSQAATRK